HAHPEEVQQLPARLRFLGDALHREVLAGMRLAERDRIVRLGRRHAGNGIAVRAGAGHAELLGEPLLHHGRERVLEAMRLVVGARPVEPEHVGQPALEQAMTARHGLRDAAALRGEADLLLAREADVALALHAPERLGDGRRGDVHVPREPRADDGLVTAREVVDRAEIVLDGRSGFHGPRIPDGPGSGKPRRRRPSWGTIGAEDSPMDFALTEAQEMIRKEVAALARGFSLDYWLEKDEKAEYPYEFIKAFADAGWLGLMVPEAYGGAGLGVTEAAIMLHEICASGAGTSGASPIHFYVFPPTPVGRYGTEELKRRELPRIVTGET